MAMPTWLQEAGVLGTWVVGLLALFGDRIRAMVFRPKLHLELKREASSYCPQIVRQRDGTEVTKHAHYYHLRVTTRCHAPPGCPVAG
jgi:hypothetical protein